LADTSGLNVLEHGAPDRTRADTIA
jgi:hypothetical protein